MKRLQFCLVVFAVLALTCSAFAQMQNGQFSGTVLDPTGAAVAGAKVTVTNQGTGLSVSSTTNSSGNYTVKEMPIGTYKVTAEASGFKTTSDNNIVLNAGVIAHVDFKLTIGKATEVIEVTGAAVTVQTDDAKLYNTVSSTEISNTVLSGRDIFDLMTISPGAVSVTGTDFENGHGTVVNGLREDFNGFLINGVSNKGLSGGEESTPISDTVEEFQQLGLNMSAQYGNSAGSTVNLVTKSGTNALHGSAFEYLRNEAADANDFTLNSVGAKRPPYRWNQFGGTVGGPIVKDKLFFFLAYEKSLFKTSTASTITDESPAWRTAVAAADANTGVTSTANLLYGNYAPKLPGQQLYTVDQYISGVSPGSTSGFASYADYLCPDSYGVNGLGGTNPLVNAALAARMQSILGVVPAVDNATVLTLTGAPCSTPMTAQAGTVQRDPTTGVSNMDFQDTSAAIFSTRTSGNFFNGRRMSGRLDYNWNANNRLSANFQWQRDTDEFGPCSTACTRGFTNPQVIRSPNGQLSYIHTFSPTVLNEFKVGYSQNVNLIGTNTPGVPQVNFDDGSVGFGSYNGYPQYFRENIYTYSDMVSVSHGNHNMKIGADFRRNIENSQFSVSRGSYYFADPIFFAADAPYTVTAGVNPEICKSPCSLATIQAITTVPIAQEAGNVRHWRNLEMGAYFQDDWKASKRLTLQLGLRYDLYKRHSEEGNTATTFLPGPGSNVIEQVINANIRAGDPGCTTPVQMAMAQVAGVCGPGGFAASTSLGKGRHKDFGPRVGFALYVFGDGKTSLRGGFGLSYEGTLYNPLSNSRWNLPYYSFDEILAGGAGGAGVTGSDIVYGPSVCDGTGPSNCHQVANVAATYTGAPTNPNQGPAGQPQAKGNLDGWDPSNPNLANLTGIVLQKGDRDPYVYNFHFGIQREILSKTVLDVKYVGTAGHKLFRAEDVNRQPGSYLPAGTTVTDNFGHTWNGLGGRLNPNYLKLRAWENAVNSNYNSLQASLKRQMSHGLLFNVDYTYAHSIDNGSTWHSGATTANGTAAGEGYTTSNTDPGLDRGDSIYDIRHRLVVNYVYQLPGQSLKGAAGMLLGGWSYNGIWAFQSGAHWEPTIGTGPKFIGTCDQAGIDSGSCQNIGGDFNLDGGHNDRPNSTRSGIGSISHDSWANGFGQVKGDPGGVYTYTRTSVVFSPPCLACVGNLGRNSFVGPSAWYADMTLSKIFKITERVNMKFDANGFNVFNHTNFLLASVGGNANNNYTRVQFGQAKATLTPRELQFGVKLSF